MKGPQPNMEVRQRAVELWLRGLTYAEIGTAIKLSRQRAQQLIAPPAQVLQMVATRAQWKCERCSVKLKSGHVHHANTTGRTIEDYNDIGNLQYLCIACHVGIHAGLRQWRPERGGNFAVRMSKAEAGIIKRAAARKEISVSQFMRRAALDGSRLLLGIEHKPYFPAPRNNGNGNGAATS